tara:strand:+ start:912 stop:1247 length:336 start_codon:yes stop_codon:yes gene_type:complete
MKGSILPIASITVTMIILYLLTNTFVHYGMAKLVADLKKKDWKVYVNAVNCGFCLEQIKFFGKHLSEVNVIHCDDKSNIRECSNLEALPAWKKGEEIKYGARLSEKAFTSF